LDIARRGASAGIASRPPGIIRRTFTPGVLARAIVSEMKNNPDFQKDFADAKK